METPFATTVHRGVSVARLALGVVIVGVLLITYRLASDAGDLNPFNYFGYFTNLTSLLASVILIITGMLGVAGRRSPRFLTLSRAVAVSCMIIVAIIYNVLVPGTGSAPVWASVILHLIFPILVLIDWLANGDRPPLAWSLLWVVVPYPAVWITVVLVRGATDGWVPYGFLLPERGGLSIALTIVGLLGALVLAAAVVWWASRLPGLALTRRPPTAA